MISKLLNRSTLYSTLIILLICVELRPQDPSLVKYVDLLVDGDSLFYSGSYKKAYRSYKEATKLFPKKEGAKIGLYNCNLYLGKYLSANKWANNLYRFDSSDINRERVIYSTALCGDYNIITTFLDSANCKQKDKILAGWGFYNSGHYLESDRWFKKLDRTYPNQSEIDKGVQLSKDKISQFNTFSDINYIPFSYSGSDILDEGTYFSIYIDGGDLRNRFGFNYIQQEISFTDGIYDDAKQQEYLLNYQHHLSSYSNISFIGKYSEGEESYLNESYMAGLSTHFRFSPIYITLESALSKASQTFYDFELFEEVDDSFYSFQFSPQISYNYKGLGVKGKTYIYSIFENQRYSNKIRYSFDSTIYFTTKYLQPFGGYERGEKIFLHNDNLKYLSMDSDTYRYSYNLGVTLYTFGKDLSLTYKFKESIYEDYTSTSHLFGIIYNLNLDGGK